MQIVATKNDCGRLSNPANRHCFNADGVDGLQKKFLEPELGILKEGRRRIMRRVCHDDASLLSESHYLQLLLPIGSGARM